MGKLIKVTGFIDPDDLVNYLVDLDHETGLTDEGASALLRRFSELRHVEFKLVDGYDD